MRHQDPGPQHSLWTKESKLRPVLLLGCLVCAFWAGCTQLRGTEWVVQDAHGRATAALEVGQTLVVGLRGLPKNTSVRVTLREAEKGELISYYQRTSDVNGEIKPGVLWYQSGVLDERTLKARKRFSYEFASFEEADRVLAAKKLVLRVVGPNEKVLAEHSLPIVKLGQSANPIVYFSTKDGNLRNSFIANQDEEMFLTVRNLRKAKRAQVLLLPRQYDQQEDNVPLREVRPEYQEQAQTVELAAGPLGTTIPIGASNKFPPGGYEARLRIPLERSNWWRIRPENKTSTIDTGILLQLYYESRFGSNEFDIAMAGRPDKNRGPHFDFNDVFDVGQRMWGSVDPPVLPSTQGKARYAGFYVIPHGSASSGLSDQTGQIEIVPILSGCVCTQNVTTIWSSASGPGQYDVVVDFGSTAAMAQGDYQPDNTFNWDVDFIDGFTRVGAYVVDDPGLPGPFTTVAHSYEPTTTGPTDALRTDVSMYFSTPDSRVSEQMDHVPLRGVGYYPSGPGPFPLVLIVHGNHDPLHASHTGYLYLCQLLASHGIIAMSIDENFLNGGVGGEMDARAIVLLRHLQLWRQWNGTPGNLFYNMVDMSRIGLAGHSRGGEAITVANHFNTLLHKDNDSKHNFDFSIESLFAIAPVDGQIRDQYAGTPIVINNADYFIMHGSHDGDVSNMLGQKTYDRAFPNASLAGASKGLLFVHGANHNYWNTEWGSHANDGSNIVSPLAQIDAIPQQNIGRVYFSAFFQLTLLHKEAYRALLTEGVSFGSLPANVTLVHQYSDKGRLDLNDYQEDSDATTGSFSGVTNRQGSLDPFNDTSIDGSWNSCKLSNDWFTWNQTRALVAGWHGQDAKYEINLPATLGTYIHAHPYLSVRIGQLYEKPASLNLPGANQDVSIELQLGDAARRLSVSSFYALPYPVRTERLFSCVRPAGHAADDTAQGFFNCKPWQADNMYVSCDKWGDISKSVMTTVRIPLQSFVERMPYPYSDLSQLSKITIRFDRSQSGLIVLDDIQLTK